MSPDHWCRITGVGSIVGNLREGTVERMEATLDAKALAVHAGGLPRHVAIIMDGNGRWASERGLPRTEGHRRGVLAVRTIIEHARKIGLDVLTVYAFSSENWSRPVREVADIMMLFKIFLRRDLRQLRDHGVRIRVLGERVGLSPDIVALLDEAEATTRHNLGMTLCVAFNYGSRNEMVRAFQALAVRVASGELSPLAIEDELVSSALDTSGLPDPDLIIRTSGEQRLSNFLLWQAAYSEFIFTPVRWPDFTPRELDEAIAEYLRRERRFGGVAAVAGAS